MKKLIALASLSLLAIPALGETLFTCGNLSGEAYYPYQGIVPKNKAGWTKDAITGGVYSLAKTPKNDFDILYTDATKSVVSTVNDGGTVIPVSVTKDQATFIVNYPDRTVEIYYFYRNGDGNFELLVSQTKYNAPVTKASVMRGTCSR